VNDIDKALRGSVVSVAVAQWWVDRTLADLTHVATELNDLKSVLHG
jgi:hypothetical protein